MKNIDNEIFTVDTGDNYILIQLKPRVNMINKLTIDSLLYQLEGGISEIEDKYEETIKKAYGKVSRKELYFGRPRTITNLEADYITHLHDTGMSLRSIGRMYGISPATVKNAINKISKSKKPNGLVKENEE